VNGPIKDWNRYQVSDNCGEPPSQIQKNALRDYLYKADREDFDVESEIRILTQIRKNHERILSSPKRADKPNQSAFSTPEAQNESINGR